MKCFRVLSLVMSVVLVLAVTTLWAGDNPFADLVGGSKVYYSHIAVTDGWETEVAVINPTTAAASATLTPYDTNGVPVSRAVTVNLAAHGRYQVEVGTTFSDPQQIAYMLVTSATYGLKGYCKFYNHGIRASIMGSSPGTEGLFTKIDHEGWTGIAFINTAATAADITLTAYADAGTAVAVESMSVPAGAKVVKTVEQIFSQSLAAATYVAFSSDQAVVGFFLNGSADGTMLDGSQAL
ncbi:MAG: hypothetical protein JXR89_05940 [Deltaproteobacteria bacterium]|nr:hypothetical protein [Deltaproteobacteria bacterium]